MSRATPTTSAYTFYTTGAATTLQQPYYLVPAAPVPVQAEPRSNVEWLRRRVQEITDLVAA